MKPLSLLLSFSFVGISSFIAFPLTSCTYPDSIGEYKLVLNKDSDTLSNFINNHHDKYTDPINLNAATAEQAKDFFFNSNHFSGKNLFLSTYYSFLRNNGITDFAKINSFQNLHISISYSRYTCLVTIDDDFVFDPSFNHSWKKGSHIQYSIINNRIKLSIHNTVMKNKELIDNYSYSQETNLNELEIPWKDKEQILGKDMFVIKLSGSWFDGIFLLPCEWYPNVTLTDVEI